MAASHPSLGASEPKVAPVAALASDTERPHPAPPSISSAASDARLQAALSATSRADASLSTLMRAVRELTNGVSSAREANVALVGELGALADLLGAANERQLALKNRIAFLEQALESAEKEAVSERSYILEQQDAFIAGMLDDHERTLSDLHREIETTRERLSQRPTATPGMLTSFDTAATSPALATPAPAPAANDSDAAARLRLELEIAKKDVDALLSDRERTRETLLKLQAQRDEAQAAVVRLTRERDLARAEGAQNRIGDAVRQAIPLHTPTPTPAGRMASTLPPPDSPRLRTPSSPQNPVASAKPASNRKRTTDPAGAPADRSGRTTAPMPIGTARPKAPALELSPREQRSSSPPPEELAAAVHTPTTPLPPPPVLTPAPVTPRGLGDIPIPTAPPVASKRPKVESSVRPAGGYSVTNSVAPEHVNTSGMSRRPPRR